jgi:DNA-binding transcriptional MocR family regulator
LGTSTDIWALREVIATHIGFRRGARCTVDNVVVTNVAQQAFQLIALIRDRSSVCS